MIYRRSEGAQYRNGLNWSYETVGTRWWAAVVLRIGRLKLGFRYRTVFSPHFINYSEVLPK
jgi:hypothetical protein